MLAVHLLTTRPSESFDSFLLQARGAEQSDGNASLVGSFMSPLPSISKPLACQDQLSSSLTDKGRPVLLHNLTFTWLSPSSDHGDIRFTASIAKGESDSPPSLLSLSSLVSASDGEYLVIESRQISFNTFPVSIRGCGRSVSCFRQCDHQAGPTCPADLANYLAIISYSADTELLTVSMGGKIMDLADDTEDSMTEDSMKSNNSVMIY